MDSILDVYRVILWLCGVGLMVSTLEFWVIAPQFSPVGVYSWRVLQLRTTVLGGSRFESLFGEKGVRALILVRLLALIEVLVTPLGSLAFSVGMGVLALSSLVFTWRRMYGDDGSDQMNTIVLTTLFLCVGPHSNPFILQAGLWFIALQACLSYTSAGVAKWVSPIWRSGEAVYRIFNTGTYGLWPITRLLERRRWLNLSLCWSVILVETLFPLALVLPPPFNWLFLAWGVLFHLQCAVIMGLNSFFWAFLATYPAILYVASTLQTYLGIHSPLGR